MSSLSEELISKIGGSIVVSNNPSHTLKDWRERLSIKQVDLANEMKLSASVLSDYESGRRLSPGINFVRRYIEALIKIDGERGKFLERLVESQEKKAILDIGEFKKPVSAKQIIELVGGKVLSYKSNYNLNILGYTILDSIRTIYSLSGFDFYKIFGATTERVLVFTKVGLGRSPLVAIRVSQFKPRMVILHGPKMVDKIALDLAEREEIVLTLSSLKKESDFSKIFKEL
jgi:putative transcriptional regulator